MAEKPTVAFRIDEEVKQEWEDAAEGPEYNSLSHLIRLAVQRELSNGEPHRGAEVEQANTNSEVTQSLNRLERSVESIQDELEAMERESRSEHLYDLKQVLLEVLPTAPTTYNPAAPDDPDIDEAGETPRTLAGRIGADTSDVVSALDELSDSISHVRNRRDYYWKVEQ